MLQKFALVIAIMVVGAFEDSQLEKMTFLSQTPETITFPDNRLPLILPGGKGIFRLMNFYTSVSIV